MIVNYPLDSEHYSSLKPTWTGSQLSANLIDMLNYYPFYMQGPPNDSFPKQHTVLHKITKGSPC